MEKGIESYLQFLKGDQTEMRHIVEVYWDNMLLFTNGYVHNVSDAEDIAQEALIELAVRKPRLEEEHQLKAYLFKVCRNKALNHLKKYQRMVGLSPEAEEFIEDETEQIEQRMEMKESSKLLHHAMLKLPQNYREILYLRYFGDLSMKEAARIMRVTEKQATATAYQARQQLRKILEKEGYSGEDL
jgi:RNA polymerase sigma-70 factor (ECF subfamily)